MANTLTNLVPDLYEAIDVVSREAVGFIPSVSLLASAERVALNETVRVPITPAAASENATPGQLPPDDGDQVIGNNTVTISASKVVPFRWNGDEQKGLNNQIPNGGYAKLRQQQIQQALRTLVNEMEAFMGGMYAGASRAVGTAGTTPFIPANALTDTANLRKVLTDNGAPLGDLKLVADTTAGANLRAHTQLTKANEAGTPTLRTLGLLQQLHGFDIRESAGVKQAVAVGSVTGTVTVSGSVGATALTATTAAGAAVNLLAGDVITLAGDTNQYVVAAAATIGASTSGTITIAAPGLKNTASSAAPTVVGAATRNMAFARSAIVLATRLPAVPEEGDMADDRLTVTDPISGISFEFAMYKQYRRVRYEVGVAYGGSVIKPEHTALLLG